MTGRSGNAATDPENPRAMYTQCPHCQAYFEVSADQLKVGEGDVRCGQCLSIFNALLYLTEQLPGREEDDANQYADRAKDAPPPTAPPAEEDTNTTPPLPATDEAVTDNRPTIDGPGPALGDIDAVADELDPHIGPPRRSAAFDDVDEFTSQQIEAIKLPRDWLDESPEKILADTLPANEPRHAGATDTAADTTDASANTAPPQRDTAPPPRENLAEPPLGEGLHATTEHDLTANLPAPLRRQLQEEKAASLRPPATPWVIGCLLLVLVFLAQAAYFYRDQLALRKPELRPWLEQACEYLGCRLRPPPTNARIEILGWDVRSLPDAPQALLASTTLVNKNPQPQPYPLLTLSFSDMNGTPVAQRRFLPREYLPADTDIAAGMPPDTPIPVELALVDPGKRAVNFEFHTETTRLAQ